MTQSKFLLANLFSLASAPKRGMSSRSTAPGANRPRTVLSATVDPFHPLPEEIQSLSDRAFSIPSLWERTSRPGRRSFVPTALRAWAKYLNLLDERGWGWSVSYNIWTFKFDTFARAMSEEQWSEEQWSEEREAVGRNGQAIIEQHGWLSHRVGADCPQRRPSPT